MLVSVSGLPTGVSTSQVSGLASMIAHAAVFQRLDMQVSKRHSGTLAQKPAWFARAYDSGQLTNCKHVGVDMKQVIEYGDHSTSILPLLPP